MERSLLIKENLKLKNQIEILTEALAQMRATAEALAHINTYTMERMNSPLKLIVERNQTTKGAGHGNASEDEG